MRDHRSILRQSLLIYARLHARLVATTTFLVPQPLADQADVDEDIVGPDSDLPWCLMRKSCAQKVTKICYTPDEQERER